MEPMEARFRLREFAKKGKISTLETSVKLHDVPQADAKDLEAALIALGAKDVMHYDTTREGIVHLCTDTQFGPDVRDALYRAEIPFTMGGGNLVAVAGHSESRGL